VTSGITEGALDLGALAFAQQAVVDEDARQLVAHGAVHEGGRDRGIDAPGEPADHALPAHALAHAGDRVLHERGRRPCARAAAHAAREVAQHQPARLGVHDLGVELHADDRLARMGDGGEGRVLAGGDHLEAGRQAQHAVAVAHPHRALGAPRQRREQRVVALQLEQRAAVLSVFRLLDDAAELVAEQLEPVADAEHRHAEPVDLGVDARRSAREHARRAAREDDPARPPRADPIERPVVRMDLAVDLVLAQPAGDELRVLGAEIQDQDPVGMNVGGHGRLHNTAVLRTARVAGPGGQAAYSMR
jgi:hypothetical protein